MIYNLPRIHNCNPLLGLRQEGLQGIKQQSQGVVGFKKNSFVSIEFSKKNDDSF